MILPLSTLYTHAKCQESINPCTALTAKAVALHSLKRGGNGQPGDLYFQVMKYTFIREKLTAGPSEWGICDDKTMIYSGWSSRGQIGNTLTMMYYLLWNEALLQPKKITGLLCVSYRYFYQMEQMFSHNNFRVFQPWPIWWQLFGC